MDLYKILDVPKDAEKSAIKSSYRQLALKWHPGTVHNGHTLPYTAVAFPPHDLPPGRTPQWPFPPTIIVVTTIVITVRVGRGSYSVSLVSHPFAFRYEWLRYLPPHSPLMLLCVCVVLDKNPDEKELAEIMFKRIGGAYSVLSSESGRSYYDRCIESRLTPGSAAELAVEWIRMEEMEDGVEKENLRQDIELRRNPASAVTSLDDFFGGMTIDPQGVYADMFGAGMRVREEPPVAAARGNGMGGGAAMSEDEAIAAAIAMSMGTEESTTPLPQKAVFVEGGQCLGGCGFFGQPPDGLCSKCRKEKDSKGPAGTRRRPTTATGTGPLSEGEWARVIDDATRVKTLQDGHGGWQDGMQIFCGATGKIFKVDRDGDVHLKFGKDLGKQSLCYNPLALERAAKPEKSKKNKGLSEVHIGFRNTATGDSGGAVVQSNDPAATSDSEERRQQWLARVREQKAEEGGWRLEDTQVWFDTEASQPARGNYTVYVVNPGEIDARTFCSLALENIPRVIGESATGDNVTWPARGWKSPDDFKRQFRAGITADCRGPVARKISKEEADDVCSRLGTVAGLMGVVELDERESDVLSDSDVSSDSDGAAATRLREASVGPEVVAGGPKEYTVLARSRSQRGEKADFYTENDDKFIKAIKMADALGGHPEPYTWSERGWKNKTHFSSVALATVMMDRNGNMLLARNCTSREAQVLVARVKALHMDATAHGPGLESMDVVHGMAFAIQAGDKTYAAVGGGDTSGGPDLSGLGGLFGDIFGNRGGNASEEASGEPQTSESEVPQAGPIARFHPIPEMCKNQIKKMEDGGRFTLLTGSVMMGRECGLTPRMEHVLEGLERANWNVRDAVIAMRDMDVRDLNTVVNLVTPAAADRGNERAFIEHLLCLVLEAERDGRVFSPMAKTTALITAKGHLYRRVAAIVATPGSHWSDDEMEWAWVTNVFLKEEESHGWELTGPLDRIRKGAREMVEIIGSDCDPTSCVVVQYIVGEVLKIEERNRPAPSVLGGLRSTALAAYRTAMEQEDEQAWMHSKLMFVGQGRAGKTSLMNALLGLEFDANQESTIGLGAAQECTVRRIDVGGWQAKPSEEGSEHYPRLIARTAAAKVRREYDSSIERRAVEKLVQIVDAKGKSAAASLKRLRTVISKALEELVSGGDQVKYRRVNIKSARSPEHLGQDGLEFLEATGWESVSSQSMLRRDASHIELSRWCKEPVLSKVCSHLDAAITAVETPPHKYFPKFDTQEQPGEGPRAEEEATSAAAEGLAAEGSKPTQLQQGTKPLQEGKKDDMIGQLELQIESLIADELESESQELIFTVWDYGGQRVFYNMHHLFLTRYGVYCCVFNMHSMLEASEREDAISYLRFWLKSIRMHANGAPFFLVGTHKDQIQDSRSHREINDIIESADFLDSGLLHHLCINEHDDLLFYPVDNTRSADDATLEHLRQSIDKYAREDRVEGEEYPYVEKRIPTAWVSCLDALNKQHHSRPTVGLDEVRAVALSCGVRVENIPRMLQLLHDLGVFIYWGNSDVNWRKLQDQVILQPQHLIDGMCMVLRDHRPEAQGKLSKARKAHLHARLKMSHDWRAFTDGALMSDKLLTRLWSPEDDGLSYDKEYFVEMMLNFGLMCRWGSSSKVYFVPSVMSLLSDPPDLGMDLATKSCLTFDFSTKQGGFFLPTGLFEHLICELVAGDEAGTGSARQKPKLYRNAAQLYLASGNDELRGTDQDGGTFYEVRLNDTAERIELSVQQGGDPMRARAIVEALLVRIRDDTRSCRKEQGDGELEKSDSGYLLSWKVLLVAGDKTVEENAFLYRVERGGGWTSFIGGAGMQSSPFLHFRRWYEPMQEDGKQGVETEGSSKAATPTVDSSVPPSALQEKTWDFFISHRQQTGEHIAHSLHHEFGKLGKKTWIDTYEQGTGAHLVDGIRRSRALILVLSDGVLTRPWCRFEIRTAMIWGVPIFPVHEADSNKLGYFEEWGKTYGADDLDFVFNQFESTAWQRKSWLIPGVLDRLITLLEEHGHSYKEPTEEQVARVKANRDFDEKNPPVNQPESSHGPQRSLSMGSQSSLHSHGSTQSHGTGAEPGTPCSTAFKNSEQDSSTLRQQDQTPISPSSDLSIPKTVDLDDEDDEESMQRVPSAKLATSLNAKQGSGSSPRHEVKREDALETDEEYESKLKAIGQELILAIKDPSVRGTPRYANLKARFEALKGLRPPSKRRKAPTRTTSDAEREAAELAAAERVEREAAELAATMAAERVEREAAELAAAERVEREAAELAAATERDANRRRQEEREAAARAPPVPVGPLVVPGAAGAVTLLGRIVRLELDTFGEESQQAGALIRVQALEEVILSSLSQGPLPARVKHLEDAMGIEY